MGDTCSSVMPSITLLVHTPGRGFFFFFFFFLAEKQLPVGAGSIDQSDEMGNIKKKQKKHKNSELKDANTLCKAEGKLEHNALSVGRYNLLHSNLISC